MSIAHFNSPKGKILQNIHSDDSISTNTSIEISPDNKNNLYKHLDKKFQCYTYIIFLYMAVQTFEVLGNAFVLFAKPSVSEFLSLMIRIILLYIWHFGQKSMESKNINFLVRFQGFLVLFIVYYFFMCGAIVMESDNTIPYFTLASFGLNLIYGILIPILVYFITDELRKIFEKKQYESD